MEENNHLRLKRLGIDTQQEAVIYMRPDSDVCRAEGFNAHARVQVGKDGNTIIATLHFISSDLLAPGEAGLSEAAWARLNARDGERIEVSHPRPLDSLARVRAKIYGHRLAESDFTDIVRDVVAGRYSDIHLTSFVTACSASGLDLDEMIALTKAMVGAGERLSWPMPRVMDKHSVGGLPGNRTTPIVVAIAAACGLTMPKTSSRAITSPSGTADAMETLAPVDLDLTAMRRVVEKEGGCIVWGGSVHLSPADDLLIRVERVLDLDSEGQLVASVLSKKLAAGATHLVLDMPVGPTAKVRSAEGAANLKRDIEAVAQVLGINARVLMADGRQPVGRGIGPALEALDVLAVLENAAGAPQDLKERAVELAGALLELGGAAEAGKGDSLAGTVLADGRALKKFLAICDAQGGTRTPPVAPLTRPVTAERSGLVASIDNRRLSQAAKLAGAPDDKAAGLVLHARLGAHIDKGEPLFTLHAQSRGELTYAIGYIERHPPIIEIVDA